MTEERRLYDGKTVDDLRDAIEDALADLDSTLEIVEEKAARCTGLPHEHDTLKTVYSLVERVRDHLRSAR